MIREIKNKLLGSGSIVKGFIFLINLPYIGKLYDSIYFKLARKRLKEFTPEISIEPYNLCNLKCIMCSYKKMKRKKEFMSLSFFKKICDDAWENGFKILGFEQFNEPFLDKDVFNRVAYAKKKGFFVKIYSNGTIMDKRTREKLLDNPPDLLRFSVDGATKETFEKIRKGAVFEKVVKNITSLYEERNKRNQILPRIEVCFTVIKENQNELKEFSKFWKKKCDGVSFYPADSREDPKFSLFDYKKLKPYPCFNPKNLVILSNGKVALCCIDFEGEYIIGDLKKQKIADIVNSEKVKNLFKSHLNRTCDIPLCKNCSRMYIDSAFKWWKKEIN